MDIKIYQGLHDDAMNIRITVFVAEQGFIDEPDETDKTASHIVCYDNEKPIGCCRTFMKEGTSCWCLGRMAVLKEYRGKGVGRRIMKAAERYVYDRNADSLQLHSQLHSVGFYEKCGYKKISGIEYEQGEPHVWMEKERGCLT